jgi:hypothetical protein
VRISTVFEIFGHYLFKGDCMIMTYIHVPSNAPWYKEEEYTCIQLWSGEFDSFKIYTKLVLYCAHTRPPGSMTLTNLPLYYVWKFKVNFSFMGPLVLVEKIFWIFSLYKHMLKKFPYCGPTRLPWVMILTNLDFVLSENFHVHLAFLAS